MTSLTKISKAGGAPLLSEEILQAVSDGGNDGSVAAMHQGTCFCGPNSAAAATRASAMVNSLGKLIGVLQLLGLSSAQRVFWGDVYDLVDYRVEKWRRSRSRY